MRDAQTKAEVADRLRHIILKKIEDGVHPTQKAWGKEYGVSQQRLTNWLRGDNYPDIEVMLRVCEDENLTLDWIYRGKMAGVAAFWEGYLKQPTRASREASQARERQAREKT